MKQENKVTNTSLSPPIDESSKAKKTWFIMNMVDPRYQNYTRPLMLAILVAVLKFVLMITTFITVMSRSPKKTWIHPVPKIDEVRITSESCTNVTSFQQYYGSIWEIRQFMRETRNPQVETSNENIEVNVHVDMCLKRPVSLLQYHLGLTSPYRKPTGMNILDYCFVPDEFRWGYDLRMNDKICGTQVPWCWVYEHKPDKDIVFDFCDGLDEGYHL